MPQKGDLVQIKVGPTTLSKIGLVIKHDNTTEYVWVKWPNKSQWENPGKFVENVGKIFRQDLGE